MIRYVVHRVRGHQTLAARRGFLHFYHCWTCSRNWNGLILHGNGKPRAV